MAADNLKQFDTNDPVAKIKAPSFAPNFGNELVSHVLTFQGVATSLGKIYRPSDEALKHRPENAACMRNDPTVMECVESRQRACALLNWHIEPEDSNSNEQKRIADQIKLLCESIPRFMQYREQLLHATWLGKAGVAQTWGKKIVRRRMATVPVKTMPINGDKIVFRWDDARRQYNETEIGIRVGHNWQAGPSLGVNAHNALRAPDNRGMNGVAPTEFGLAYFLKKSERPLLALHKHYIEDAEYEDPHSAGRIHGVGIRSRIYWAWYQKQETLALLMEYLERSAAGFEIWYYQAGNPESEAKTRQAAQERIGSRNIILVPYVDGESARPPYERIEPGMAGAEALKSIVTEYFGHVIKRYILGQTLTSEQGSTGLGSNLASIHLETFLQIVKYDAILLEETITEELIRWLVRYNFPEWSKYEFKFRIDTESEDAESKLEACQKAYSMGLSIKAQDVYDLLGLAKPGPTDEALRQPAPMPMGAGPGSDPNGAAGAGGAPPGMTEALSAELTRRGMMGGGEGGESDPNGGSGGEGGPGKPSAPPSGGVQQFAGQDRPQDSERVKIRDYEAGERWITVGAQENGEGKRKGGFPVKIDGNGVIVAGGPKAMQGKHISGIGEHFENERRKKADEHAANSPLGKSRSYGRIVSHQAEKWGMSEDDYEHFAGQVWGEAETNAREREAAKAHARKRLGLTAGDINRLENTGFDHGSRRVKGFDTLGREMASMYPGLGWGEGYGDEAGRDLGEQLWNLIREGKQSVPSRVSPEYHDAIDSHLEQLMHEEARRYKSPAPRYDVPEEFARQGDKELYARVFSRDSRGRFATTGSSGGGSKSKPKKKAKLSPKKTKKVSVAAGDAMRLAYQFMRSKHVDYKEFRHALSDAWKHLRGDETVLYRDEDFAADKPTPRRHDDDGFDLPGFLEEMARDRHSERMNYEGSDDAESLTDTEAKLMRVAAMMHTATGEREQRLAAKFVRLLGRLKKEIEGDSPAVDKSAEVERAARETENPTDSQKESGNYRKGSVKLHGMTIRIETPKGERRRPQFKPLAAHYGYIQGTKGADGDELDVFIGPNPESEIVFVVDMPSKGGRFDEHKSFIGWNTEAEAVQALRDSYSDGWKIGAVTPMTIDQFRSWVAEGNTNKPIEPQVSKYEREQYAKPSKGQTSFNWDEDKHPRSDDGTFAPKGEGESHHDKSEEPAKEKEPHEMTLEEFTEHGKFTGPKRYFEARQAHEKALREAFDLRKTIPAEALEGYADLRDAVKQREERHAVNKQARAEYRQTQEGQLEAWEEWHNSDEMRKVHADLEANNPEYKKLADKSLNAALASDYEGDGLDPAVAPYVYRMELMAANEAKKQGIEAPENIARGLMHVRQNAYQPSEEMSEGRERARKAQQEREAAKPKEADPFEGFHPKERKHYEQLVENAAKYGFKPSTPAEFLEKRRQNHPLSEAELAEIAPKAEPKTEAEKPAEPAKPLHETEKLFRRTGSQFENLQTALGLKPQMGPKGAAAVRKKLGEMKGGRVIEAMLSVGDEHSVDDFEYDENGFARIGNDAFDRAIDGKFSREELDSAKEWLEKTFTTGELRNVNQYRWLSGVAKVARAKDDERKSKPADKADPFEAFNMKHGQGLTDEDRVPLDQQSATPVQDSKPDRSWKKNDDGTYTAPNGTVWRKAAAGGEESPVTGRMHAGGSFMPIHGLHEKPEVKPLKGSGEGDGGAGKVKDGKKTQPVTPKTPEQIEEERARRKREENWSTVKNGHIGKMLGLGDRPHAVNRSGGTKNWQSMIEEAGLSGEQVKELAAYMEAKNLQDISDDIDANPWKLSAASSGREKDATKEEDMQGFLENAKMLSDAGRVYWSKKFLKTHPDAVHAASMASYFLDNKKQGERLLDLHNAVEKLKRGESLTASAAEPKPESGGLWPTKGELEKMAPHFEKLFDAFKARKKEDAEKYARPAASHGIESPADYGPAFAAAFAQFTP